MKIVWLFLGHRKIGLVLEVMFMHFSVFFKVQVLDLGTAIDPAPPRGNYGD